MNIERGDSVKFGVEYCKTYGREELIGSIVKFTPQWFEEDNGLFVYQEECPGIDNGENTEPDSIYHLFGNEFENFMDCVLIKGSDEDKLEYEKIIKDFNDAEAKCWDDYLVSNT